MPQKPPIRKVVPFLDARALLGWYDRNARALPWRTAPADRAEGVRPDPYRVWLSEIMLQQTTIPAVRGYFVDFLDRWPTVADLAEAPIDEVLAAWAGLGYYARARNLHRCAQIVARDLGGVFPKTSQGLQKLPGIGPYTAAAIAAICQDEQIAVVDGNVERVVARLLALDTPVRDARHEIRQFVQDVVPKRAGDFAQALMDLGATICTPRRAACDMCPLQPGCRAARLPDPAVYPRKPDKPLRPNRHGHAFVVARPDGAVFLRRRLHKGLLGGMTETPGSDWSATATAPVFPLRGDWRESGTVIHVFTHFRLELTVWRLALPPGLEPDPGQGWWCLPGERAAAGLPSVFRKVLAMAAQE